MKFRLFSAQIEPSCSYCAHGRHTCDGNAILCKKRGVVTTGFSCNKFVYNPLKRNPRPAMLPEGFYTHDKSDFDL